MIFVYLPYRISTDKSRYTQNW